MASSAASPASNAVWNTLDSSNVASNAVWKTLESSDLASNVVWKALNSSNVGQASASNLLFGKFSSPAGQDVPMQIDASTSHCYAPTNHPRSILKEQRRPPTAHKRRVSFRGSVDVRVSLADPAPQELWYTADEIKSMKSAAMNRVSPLRHSDVMEASKTLQLQQHLLSSPPPPLPNDVNAPAPFVQEPAGSSLMSRVHSANAELNAAPAAFRPSPRDIRYKKLVGELDGEVYISNADRRNSTRRRLHHYSKVLDEIDRQVDEGYMMLNVHELAHASRAASGNAMARALERARKEATVAQAIALADVRRL